jgi:hypothetical protein
MGLRDSMKRAVGGATTPDRPTNAAGGRQSVSSNEGGEPNGRERSGSLGNLLGSHSDKRKSTDIQDGDDAEVLDEGEGNVLLSLISQRQSSPTASRPSELTPPRGRPSSPVTP